MALTRIVFHHWAHASQRRVGAMLIDLKVLIGMLSREVHDLPRMDPLIIKAAVKVVEANDCTVQLDMSKDDWTWWRVTEHIREVNHPTQTVRDWMKFEPTDEDEPRVIETCEALRQGMGGPCPNPNGHEIALHLCKGVSPFEHLPGDKT